jgi:hypothetical protein
MIADTIMPTVDMVIGFRRRHGRILASLGHRWMFAMDDRIGSFPDPNIHDFTI